MAFVSVVFILMMIVRIIDFFFSQLTFCHNSASAFYDFLFLCCLSINV